MKKINSTIISLFFLALPFIARAELANPLGAIERPEQVYGRVIAAFMGFVGVLSLAVFVYGGMQLILSKGNEEMITRGKDTIVWAVIGMGLVFTSYAILRFVISTLSVSTNIS